MHVRPCIVVGGGGVGGLKFVQPMRLSNLRIRVDCAPTARFPKRGRLLLPVQLG